MTGYHTSSLQQIVQRVVGDSREKLAQFNGASAPAAPLNQRGYAGGSASREEQEKTASVVSDMVKLAEACEFCAENLGSLVDDRPDEVKVAEAMQLLEHLQKTAVGGESITDSGNAPARLTPPKVVPTGVGLQGPADPGNALQNDQAQTPGGTGTQPYKKDGKVTPPVKANEKAWPTDSATAMQTDENDAPGGGGGSVPTASYPDAGPIKQAGVPDRFTRALAKMAGAAPAAPTEPASIYEFLQAKLAEDSAATTVSASRDMSTTVVDGGDYPGTASGEGVPVQPKQNEGVLRALVTGSTQKVIDMTPRDTVGPQKKRMAEILDTPMQSASLDSKLTENLGADAVAAAGTKLSSAAGRALLGQILEGHYGEEGHAKLAQAARYRLSKLGQDGGDNGVEQAGAASQGPGTSEEDVEKTKKEKKEKALQNLLTTAAQAQGEKKEE